MAIRHWLVSEEVGLLNPSSWQGAIFYGVVFGVATLLLVRLVRLAQKAVLLHHAKVPISHSSISYTRQFFELLIYVVSFAFYAHLIPELRSLGTALLAGVSVVSIVLGLAAQHTLGNFIAGLSLLLYRPFHLGDRVQVNAPTGTETGEVEDVTLGYTVLKTFDNRRVVVPNSLIANQVMVNLTTLDPRVIAIVPIGIGYTSDVERARAILIELARAHALVEEVLSCPVTEVGSSSITLSLRAWTRDAGSAKQITFDLFEGAKKRFDAEGIEIPYPYANIVLKREGDAG